MKYLIKILFTEILLFYYKAICNLFKTLYVELNLFIDATHSSMKPIRFYIILLQTSAIKLVYYYLCKHI